MFFPMTRIAQSQIWTFSLKFKSYIGLRATELLGAEGDVFCCLPNLCSTVRYFVSKQQQSEIVVLEKCEDIFAD